MEQTRYVLVKVLFGELFQTSIFFMRYEVLGQDQHVRFGTFDSHFTTNKYFTTKTIIFVFLEIIIHILCEFLSVARIKTSYLSTMTLISSIVGIIFSWLR